MTKDMTQGSPLKLLLAFAVPLMLGSLFQQFYNLADTIIVGRFVGVEALAAVGSVGGLNYLVLGFVNGIACGFSIPISWTFGAHDHHEMRRYTANTVWLSIAFATVLTIVTVAMTRLVLVWTNTPADIIDLADVRCSAHHALRGRDGDARARSPRQGASAPLQGYSCAPSSRESVRR